VIAYKEDCPDTSHAKMINISQSPVRMIVVLSVSIIAG